MTGETPWATRLGTDLIERGLVHDRLVRAAIRRLVAERLREQGALAPEARARFVASLGEGRIAEQTAAANTQHYEWPAALFEKVLGPRLKYSCAWFESANDSLAKAEERMLALTCERAGIADGMQVLDLGCGWGSFGLWVAERFPAARVLAVSNSKPQREFIERRCAERGLAGVEVVTADVNEFEPTRRFDRIVSIEMIEHVRNWQLLFQRAAGWLAPEGRVFLHHFAHRDYAYPYEDDGARDWMARHFFTGGIMPSADLVRRFPEHLVVEESWRVGGEHYAATCDAWLVRLDAARTELRPIYEAVVGRAGAARAHQRWRLFFMACAELFRFDKGGEWQVAHHRLRSSG